MPPTKKAKKSDAASSRGNNSRRLSLGRGSSSPKNKDFKDLTLPKQIRLERLEIKNFKILEKLSLDFPSPRFSDDPDIMVLGSKNGLGKTSVLEAIALLFFAASRMKGGYEEVFRSPSDFSPLSEVFVRAGMDKLSVGGEFMVSKEKSKVDLDLDRSNFLRVKGSREISNILQDDIIRIYPRDDLDEILPFLMGLSSDSMVQPGLLYFHSFRKVQEGKPELGSLIDSSGFYEGNSYPSREFLNLFKSTILKYMVSKGGFVEGLDEAESDEVLDKLNGLVSEYADAIIDKLKPFRDNTFELRIRPRDKRVAFSIDGLSSGQKEIISTLFLIWESTRNRPSIVLIDEPELHLNVEWQHSFTRNLVKLAPQNQYILATHSDVIFRSVPDERRITLKAD